jgi:hypothetical protein
MDVRTMNEILEFLAHDCDKKEIPLRKKKPPTGGF